MFFFSFFVSLLEKENIPADDDDWSVAMNGHEYEKSKFLIYDDNFFFIQLNSIHVEDVLFFFLYLSLHYLI